jgi:hypothetical protein
MQEATNSITETNVFLDFQIIQDSNLVKLSEEMDILIAGGKTIYIWSKTISPENMKKFCIKLVVPTPTEEKELHNKIFLLRHKDRKTFREISEELKIPLNKVSYFSKADPLREWTLDDWIEDYLPKDPSLYQKVDYLVDPNEKLVDKFKRAGRNATLVKEIK